MLEAAGEAAGRVSEPTRLQLPQVPWGAIVHMRHRLVHEYFRINLDILWQTIVEDLPELLPLLRHALEEEAP